MPDRELASCLADRSSRGPRYTSYPPATELAPMTAEPVERELATLGATAAGLSLYVHVPFCRSLCWYCGCNVIPTRDTSRGDGYVARVLDEAAVLAPAIAAVPITELALGGGSPNFLTAPALRALLGGLAQRFALRADARRSIELDPRTATSEQIDVLAGLGFTALSVGVQDFAEAVQDAIHRHQSILQTRWLVDRARAAGFDDVNLDIVYGLPRQTERSFARTLDAVIELAPDRVALFGYAHLPERLPHQRLVERAGPLPDPLARATLLLLGIERLTAAGYVHLGLDHFAASGSRLARAAAAGRMVRTFQGYVERRADAIVGLGVSAISSTPRMHWANHTDLEAWERDLAAGRLAVARGMVLDADDQVRAALVNRLMCDAALDLDRLGAEHGIDAERYFAAELEALGELADLARYDPATRGISTTPLGRLLIRNVCLVFDRYARPGVASRFSATI